jgi:hypothetical protein
MTSTTYAPILPPPPQPAAVTAPCRQDKQLFVPQRGPQSGAQSATSLPAVCVKCGQPATVQKKKVYYWHQPLWYFFILLGLLLYAILALIVRKSIRLNVPLCAEHASKLSQKKIMTAVLLLGFLPVGIGGSVLGDQFVGWAWLTAGAMFLAGLIYAVIASRCYMTPTHIDANYASFRGPCEQFLRQLPMKA